MLFPTEVFEAVVALVVEAGLADSIVDPAADAAAPVPPSAKPVIVTGRYVISINPRVEVPIPGVWAETPLKDEVHTPAVAGKPVRVQPIYPVLYKLSAHFLDQDSREQNQSCEK